MWRVERGSMVWVWSHHPGPDLGHHDWEMWSLSGCPEGEQLASCCTIITSFAMVQIQGFPVGRAREVGAGHQTPSCLSHPLLTCRGPYGGPQGSRTLPLTFLYEPRTPWATGKVYELPSQTHCIKHIKSNTWDYKGHKLLKHGNQNRNVCEIVT